MTVSSYGNLPKLTVAIVVRNGAASIGHTLDSVKAQHYPKLEVVVWDGLSTDNTLEVVGRYHELVARTMCERDDGPPDAYNRVLAHCTGDFLCYLNADDEMEPGMLWAVAEAILKEPEADVVSTGMIHRLIDRSGRKRVIGYYAGEEQLALTLENVLCELPTFFLSRFIRRELMAKIGPFNTVKEYSYISNDREWMARLALLPAHNVVVAKALYGFNLHAGSISVNPQNFLRIIDEHLLIADELLKRPELSEAQRKTVIRWQRRQTEYGFLKSLTRLQFGRIKEFFKRGMALSGWRFLPCTFLLLVSRVRRKLGLMMSGGIDRG